MHYSKFAYLKILKNERNVLEKKRKREFEKRTKDTEKINRIENLLKEVRNESQKVEGEIKEWLETVPLSSEMKAQIVEYYINEHEFYDKNFHRNIRTLFDEN